MDVADALIKTAEQFQSHPLQFVLERDLQFDVLTRLSRRAAAEDEALVEIKRHHEGTLFSNPSRETTTNKSIANYKERYLKELNHEFSAATPTAYPVHAAGAPDSGSSRNQRSADGLAPRVRPEFRTTRDDGSSSYLDVVVLDSSRPIKMKWNDGSVLFDSDEQSASDVLDAAIEIKYVKNKSFFPFEGSHTVLRNEDGSCADDIRSKMHNDPDGSDESDRDANNIQSDIFHLQNLSDEGVDSYLIIFSNYNYMYLSDVYDTLTKSRELRKRTQSYVCLGKAVDAWLSDSVELIDSSEGDFSILYVHPFGHRTYSSSNVFGSERPRVELESLRGQNTEPNTKEELEAWELQD